ncbi:phenazine biosynthesis protein phzE [Halopolyspora algeriensis]|uniref:anthranilate synthase n=1 Tax=Halopolyspora algeriensis TaxID=1500506 RepID=A0A368VEV9_9ACTN|nr:anthranilate synthase family protein [Halopolyspora algeriensis]RCW39666.1 phenazine biosynthesis protein phzE [Halopolyspora algeriensis]TQM54041.1 phenazine biosynthesis protein phzE [Halopolyspora algeriensis]
MSTDHEKPSATELIARLSGVACPAFAVLCRWSPETGQLGDAEVLIGDMETVEHTTDIPLPHGAPTGHGTHDALALVPFRQIRERGFDCHDDATELQVLRVAESHRVPREELLAALPQRAVALHDGGFDLDDDTYESIVEQIVHDEIASGEGANFVIRRDYTARLDDHTSATALALLRQLLTGERGAYWTFVVHTGSANGHTGRTLVGASPETHVRMDSGDVLMNPISGTYRYPKSGPDIDGLLHFLRDSKEIGELSMVLDEELKMMSAVGDRGGQVHGPYLREMAHLAHTEFEIRGRTSQDARDVLRETMFAATVTGSPLENACRVIQRHEHSGRGYYAGALALFSRDSHGDRQLDSPILIRAADIAPDGHLRIPVGATLVRDSDPSCEVAETWTKAAGVLTALGAGTPAAGRHDRGSTSRPTLRDDPRVAALLAERRRHLSPFWLQPRDAATAFPAMPGRALIIDTGDSFTAMLAQLLHSTGLRPQVYRYDDAALDGLLDDSGDLVVLGPGPGDPNDVTDPRMHKLHELARSLLRQDRPLLGVCLGHQLLARHLGLPVSRKPRPHQGVQKEIDVFGRRTTVGFYNSFTAHADAATTTALREHGIELCRETGSGDVLALRGPAIAGVQFHPESALTLDGQVVLQELLRTGPLQQRALAS